MPSIAVDHFSLLGPRSSLPPDPVIFGHSDAMQAVRQKVERVAASNVPVLIQGESGTGKEIVAHLIHRRSPWAAGPFVKVNCPALPGPLLESELFPYETRSGNGSGGAKTGRTESGDRGTLFLDEIAELHPNLQAKLLQLLPDGQCGGMEAQEGKTFELRILCATTSPLEHGIEAGAFRHDLFYRLNVVTLQLPRLRQRKEDIPELVDYFFQSYSEAYRRQTRPPSAQFLQLLQNYEWPGNIRELENVIRRYVLLRSEETIIAELVNQGQRPLNPEILPDASISLKKVTRQAVQELEAELILKFLEANQWNRKRVARALNISYRALLYKIKGAGLPMRRGPGAQRTAEITSQDQPNQTPRRGQ